MKFLERGNDEKEGMKQSIGCNIFQNKSCVHDLVLRNKYCNVEIKIICNSSLLEKLGRFALTFSTAVL